MSSTEAASRVIRSFVDAFNRAEPSGIAAEFAEDGTLVGLGDAGQLRGRAAIERYYAELLSRMPGAPVELEEVETSALGDDRAIARSVWRTHVGDGPPMRVRSTGVAERRGKVIEVRLVKRTSKGYLIPVSL